MNNDKIGRPVPDSKATRPSARRRAGTSLALFALVATTSAFPSQWLQDGREPPLYPSIITTEYKGKTYPVTAVSAEVPEIWAEGKLMRLYSAPSYRTPRALGYAPGYIQFKAQSANSVTATQTIRVKGSEMMGNEKLSGGKTSESGEYECTLVSNEAHPDCYLAVIFFQNDASGNPDASTTAIAFRQIGDLAAGRETKVTVNSGYIVAPDVHFYYFPLVYSKGLEIRSDLSEVAAGYFRRGEMTAHEAMLAKYRQQNPTADRPAIPYLKFQPELPVDVAPNSLPPTVNAKFAVTETGEVDSIELDQVLDIKADREVRRALNGWLFLPRLKKGYPVRSMAQVPLSFRPASP
jgi:hypothetical protein